MSVSPEGRTRGIFGGLKTGDYTPRELPTPRTSSRRLPWGEIVPASHIPCGNVNYFKSSGPPIM